MSFGGKVNDCVDSFGSLGDCVGVLNCSVNETQVARIALKVGKVFAPTSVGQLVKHDDLVIGLSQAQPDKV